MAVKIQQYQQRTVPDTLGVTPRARGVQVDDSQARALGQAANAMAGAVQTYANVQQQIKAEAARQEQEDAKVWSASALAQARLDMQRDMTAQQDAIQPGAPGFAQGMDDRFSDYEEKVLASAPNDTSRKFLQERMAALRVDVLGGAMSFEADERRRWRVDTGKQAIDATAAAMAADPARLPVALAEQRAMIDAYDIPQQQKRALHDYLNETVGTAAVLGDVQRDPVAARKKLAARLGIDESAIAGPVGSADVVWSRMIQRESGGKQSAVSPKGAIGIAQVMPDTGPTAARMANLPWDPERFRSDAHYNAALGRAYYEGQLREFGSPALAAAAYNAGPGAVREWIGRFGDPRKGEISVAEFAAKIPYKETREYVAAVAAPGGPTAQAVVAAGDPGMATGEAGYDLLPVPKVVQLLGQTNSEIDKQQAQFRSYVATRETDDLAAYGDGKQPPQPLTVGEFVSAYGDVEGMQRWSRYQGAQAVATEMAGLTTATPAEIQATIKARQPLPGEGYAVASQQYAALVQAATRTVAARAEDPVQFAMGNGLTTAQPLNLQDTAEFSAGLKERVGLAETMAGKYGTGYTLLSKQEAAQMGAVIGQMSAPEKMQFLGTIRGALPDQRSYFSVLAQMQQDSPVTAVAGAIAVQTTPITVQAGGLASRVQAMRPEAVASTILAGESILKGDESARAFKMPKDADLRAVWDEYVGGAYRGSPEAADASYKAFRSFYAGAAQQQGIQTGELDEDLARMGVRAVTGGVVDVNDAKVVTPWGMPEDRFLDVLRGEFNRQAKAAGRTDEFDAVTFTTTGNGLYQPSIGTLPLPFQVRVNPGVPMSGMIGGMP